MTRLIRKLDSFKSLIIIIVILLLLSTSIVVILMVNTAETINVYRDSTYEIKKTEYVREIENQVEKYSTAMRITALNPTIRENIFRGDVSPAEMMELSSEMKRIINASTYLLTNQEDLKRHVFYSDLPSDGKHFYPYSSMKNQGWYNSFLDDGSTDYITFVYDYLNSQYDFLMLQTINNFNIAKPGLSKGAECYEVMRIKVDSFFPSQGQESDHDLSSHAFLFYSASNELVYSSNESLEGYAREYYANERGIEGEQWENSEAPTMKLAPIIHEVPEMDAYLVILFEEMLFSEYISGSGVLPTIIILMTLAIFIMFILLAYYFNLRERINSIVFLLDNFDENASLAELHSLERSDEISKIENHTVEMQNRIKTLIEEEYKIKLQNVSAQYEALRANVNPHFLYNTLNSIAITASMEGADDTREMIIALSDMFKYSADMSHNKVTLADELKNIKDYLYIQEIRYNRNFAFRVAVDDQLLSSAIPKLILQPIVENCFKHGFKGNINKENEPNEVIISAYKEGIFLKIYVMDNGRGIDQENLNRINEILRGETPLEEKPESSDSTEIGISNVNKRLKLLYGNSCGIEISCEEGKYTCVKLKLLYEEQL